MTGLWIAGRENAMENLLASAPVGLFQTGPDGRVLAVNDRWCACAGLDRKVVVGQKWDKPVHPEDRVRVAAAWMRSVASLLDFSLEFRFRAPDGKVIQLWGLATAVLGPSGDLAGYAGAVIDITERKRAEHRIQESEDRFRALVLSGARIVWTMSPRGEVVAPQASWQAFTGQTEEEMRGWGWTQVLHPEDAPAALSTFKASLESRQRFDARCRIRHFEGGYRRFTLRAVPVLDEKEQVREWAGMCTEVSEPAG
jgi:PAS domain S-box-containing protein